jgi:hypothetical protein
LGDLRFVAVAAIAGDVKETHLGAVVSNNGVAHKAPHQGFFICEWKSLRLIIFSIID